MTNTVTFSVDLTVFRKLLGIADKLGVSPNRAAKYIVLMALQWGLSTDEHSALRAVMDDVVAAQQPKRTTPRLLS